MADIDRSFDRNTTWLLFYFHHMHPANEARYPARLDIRSNPNPTFYRSLRPFRILLYYSRDNKIATIAYHLQILYRFLSYQLPV